MSLNLATKGRIFKEAVSVSTWGKIWRYTEWVPRGSAYHFFRDFIIKTFVKMEV